MRILNSPLSLHLSGLAVLAVLSFAVLRVQSDTVEFASIEDARDFFQSRGLHCHLGTSGAPMMDSFFVADHPLAFDDILAVSFRSQCGEKPEWKGVLWVVQLQKKGSATAIDVNSIGGKTRVWGNIVVAGDNDLMDHIEKLYRDQ